MDELPTPSTDRDRRRFLAGAAVAGLTAAGVATLEGADEAQAADVTADRVIVTNSSTSSGVDVTQSADTGTTFPIPAAVAINNSANPSHALAISTTKVSASRALVRIESRMANPKTSANPTGDSFNQPLLQIIENDNDGGVANCRLDGRNPDLELVCTAQTAPSGRFEIAVPEAADCLQLNGRNDGDSSFDPIAILTRPGTNGGKVGIGISSPGSVGAKLHIAGSEDTPVLMLRPASGQTQNIVTIRDDSNSLVTAFTKDGALQFAATDGRGFIEFFEQASAPSTPAANRARLFGRDNGSGKTQLCARFPSGAVQVLATEP